MKITIGSSGIVIPLIALIIIFSIILTYLFFFKIDAEISNIQWHKIKNDYEVSALVKNKKNHEIKAKILITLLPGKSSQILGQKTILIALKPEEEKAVKELVQCLPGSIVHYVDIVITHTE